LLIGSPERSCVSPPLEKIMACIVAAVIGLGRFRISGFRSQAATAALVW
jgi:hypothetical protein